MSKSSPADLAIAFKSLPRRLREAAQEGPSPAEVTAATAAVDAAIAAAASVMRSAPTAEAVSDAIASRHPIDWTDSDLDAVQNHANAAARAIRDLEDA
jgi:hypothetical protein